MFIYEIEKIFGSYLPYNSGVRVNCPYCELSGKEPDTKFHLHICTRPTEYNNITNYWVHCFRCGFSSTTPKIINVDEDYFQLIDQEIEEEKNKLKEKLDATYIFNSQVKLINESTSKTAEAARNYLKSRGIYAIDGIYFGLTGKLLGRIVFPIIEEGEFVYWTARTFTNQKPKYLNTPIQKKGYIYNLEKIKNLPQVVITEGVFDTFFVQGGISLFGKVMTEAQKFNFLNNVSSDKVIYVGLDNDAILDSLDLCEFLIPYYEDIKLMLLPKNKDLCDVKGKVKSIKVNNHSINKIRNLIYNRRS